MFIKHINKFSNKNLDSKNPKKGVYYDLILSDLIIDSNSNI